ncbi:MAG: hypothetical protein ACE5KA_09425, partial [Nitrososphaerales archaeon]
GHCSHTAKVEGSNPSSPISYRVRKVLNTELLNSGLVVIDTRFCHDSEFSREHWAQQYGC